MTYGNLQADCLYTGISSGPNTRYRVWEAFTFFYCYRPSSMVCLSVCHDCAPCKNCWTDRHAVGMCTWVGPVNRVLGGRLWSTGYTVHVRRRCGLLSNYFCHLMLLLLGGIAVLCTYMSPAVVANNVFRLYTTQLSLETYAEVSHKTSPYLPR